MKVEVHQATLTVEGKIVKLNKAVAKQFPILNAEKRWRAMEKGELVAKPIAKVAGRVLYQQSYLWMYLVPDPTAGLAWVAAMQTAPAYEASIIERGGYVDDPASVPTIIL